MTADTDRPSRSKSPDRTPIVEARSNGSPARTIARVDLFSYDLTYVHGEYLMSGGRAISSLSSTVVQLTTVEGAIGFGETCPLGAIICQLTPLVPERRWSNSRPTSSESTPPIPRCSAPQWITP
jgi:hypothetical protein